MEKHGRCFDGSFTTFEDGLLVAGLLDALDITQDLTALANIRTDFLSSDAKDVAVILKNMRDVLKNVMQHGDTHSTYVLRQIAIQACILMMPEVDECKPFPEDVDGFNTDFLFTKYRKD